MAEVVLMTSAGRSGNSILLVYHELIDVPNESVDMAAMLALSVDRNNVE
jgi:hypothetical protein